MNVNSCNWIDSSEDHILSSLPKHINHFNLKKGYAHIKELVVVCLRQPSMTFRAIHKWYLLAKSDVHRKSTLVCKSI